MLVLVDNNTGGNPCYLRECAQDVQPLRLRWGSCSTFSAALNADLVAVLAARAAVMSMSSSSASTR